LDNGQLRADELTLTLSVGECQQANNGKDNQAEHSVRVGGLLGVRNWDTFWENRFRLRM